MQASDRVRILAWNIRAGGGVRVDGIASQIDRWRPDVVALSEFRGTEPGIRLRELVARAGLTHQLATTDATRPSMNALMVASRWPLEPLRLPAAPVEPCRWLCVRVAAPSPFVTGAMHVPNRVSGRKYPYLDAVLACLVRWRHGPALLLGDTNSGRRGIDEAVPAFNAREEGWIDALAHRGWADAFRAVRGEARAYTWYSPNGGNGFRIDQAFVNASLVARLRDARYVWGRAPGSARRDALSDHAALLVDFAGA